MDCTTFQNSEIDALYGELDAAASAAMAEHAATCAACSARYERLSSTRGLVLSVALESVSASFESRVMAAVEPGLAQAGRAPAAAAAAKAEQAQGGAKIFKFMARPAFAVAATFVLVIGAAAILMQNSMQMKSPASAVAQAPGEVAASAALSPVQMPSDPASPAATATAATVAALAAGEAAPSVMPPAAAPLAFADNSPPPEKAALGVSRAASPPPAPMARPPTVVAAKPTKSAAKAGPDELAGARSLAAAGRCSEALPKLEALKGSHPEAELYAARCTGSCGRFDIAAQRNAGTETGNRATLEGAKCYQAKGDVVAARKRYVAAKDEGVAEASQALDQLDRKTGPGTAGGGKAAPKAPAPSPVEPAAVETIK